MVASSAKQPAWVAEAFAKVAASDFAEITGLFIFHEDPRPDPVLLRLYGKLDRWAFGADPAATADLGEALAHGNLIHHPTTEQLLALDLDVLFVVGDLDDRAYDGIARYGVWRFCFGPERADPESLAAWREVAEGAPVTGSGIKVRLTANAAPRLAYQSRSRTYPLSVARNRDRVLRKTTEFAYRALRELHRSGHGWLGQCKVLKAPGRPAAISGKLARNVEVAKNLSGIGARILQRGVEKLLDREQWFLAFRFRESRFGDSRSIPRDLQGYTRIMPPRDRIWADPFALEKNGRYFVFFEEMLSKEGKGHISMLELKRDGSYCAPQRVLERDYHLSYPFLVEQDGQLLMIPESSQNGTVEAYRCIDFPLTWRRERILLDGMKCVDATFHRGSERWWMFANAAAPGLRKSEGMFDDELHLFHSSGLLGDWKPHARNPVKSDARCARPAGGLYWQGGALYRPAQICAPLYGAGLSINRVLRLTPTEYAERQVERILPAAQGGVLGLHTINRAGDLTVIDVFSRQGKF